MATKAKDRVTPDQARRAGDHVAEMAGNYSNGARLQCAISNVEYPNRLRALWDELGYDPTVAFAVIRKFYREFFRFDCPDLSDLVVPPTRSGFDWVLPIVAIDPVQPIEVAYHVLKGTYAAKYRTSGGYKYTDQPLDVAIPSHDRDPLNGSYVIRLRARQEADEEHRNRSANQLKDSNILGTTLYERLILDGWYYAKTGKHLDVQNWTLCSGSRAADGDVPSVCWYPDSRQFYVYLCYPDCALVNLRAREVVSYP